MCLSRQRACLNENCHFTAGAPGTSVCRGCDFESGLSCAFLRLCSTDICGLRRGCRFFFFCLQSLQSQRHVREEALQLLQGFAVVFGDVEIAIVRRLVHGNDGVKTSPHHGFIGHPHSHAIHGKSFLRIDLKHRRLRRAAFKELVRVQGSWHELKIDVASSPGLAHVIRGRAEWCISLEDGLAELVVVVGRSYVWSVHKPFAPPPYTLGDCFGYSSQACTNVGECENVKKPESACNDSAFSECLLGSLLALFGHVLDASGGAIVVVIELMQRSEVACIAQCKLVGVLDEVFAGSGLCNAGVRRFLDSKNVFGVFLDIPDGREGCSGGVGVMASHAHLIQHLPCSRVLRESIRRHQALVTAF